jgi:hypothetical protein
MGASTKSKRKGQTLRNLIPLIMQPPWTEMAFIKADTGTFSLRRIQGHGGQHGHVQEVLFAMQACTTPVVGP